MAAKDSINRRTIRQAAAWSTEIDCGILTESKRAEFHKWMDSPDNAQAFKDCRLWLSLLESLSAERAASLCALPSPAPYHPGYFLTVILRILLTDKAFALFVEPVIADMQYEHLEALEAGRLWPARLLVIRSYLSVIPGCLYALFARKLLALLRRDC